MQPIGTFKKGTIKKTDGQLKKHFTQMTNDEISKLNEKIASLDIRLTKISGHLNRKMQEGDMTFTAENIVRLFQQFTIIEYNNTNGQNRVLIRGKHSEQVVVRGKNIKSNLCIVINLDLNEIVTAYWNKTQDSHISIDFSRYDADLKIKL